MAYIDAAYYNEMFHGAKIPDEDFDRLATAASDIIDSLVVRRIVEVTDGVKNAVAYQVEMLYQQGGLESITGNASGAFESESLGDYSVSTGTRNTESASKSTVMLNGIPVSTITISLLRREGLMGRCFYDGRLP